MMFGRLVLAAALSFAALSASAQTRPKVVATFSILGDLVAEVASPSQHRPEMAAQAQMYLDRGVALGWILGPARQEVDVWRSGLPTVNAWQDRAPRWLK